MDKNFFIALTAALLVFFGYNTFTAQKQIQQKQADIAQQINLVKEKQATLTASAKKSSVSVNTKKQETEKLYTVETEHAKIVFTSKGAAIKDFIYKDFDTDLNLTPFGNEGYFATLPEVNFEQVQPQKGEDIAFKTKLADGVFLVKSYTINKNQGLNTVNISLTNKGKEDLSLSDLYLNMGPGLNTVKSELSDNSANLRAYCARQEKGKKNISVNKIKAKFFDDGKTHLLKETCENWLWAGVDNRYFLSALIPTNWKGSADGFAFSEHFLYETPSFFGLFGKTRTNGPDLKILVPAVLPAGRTVNYSSDFYLGPKDLNLLESLPYDLQRSIQFGFFGQLGKWMRNLLEWLNKYTHNYGFAIILMSFLIQIILSPLTYKQLKSAAVMQRIQPQMKVIQERYKSDPMRAQQEMIALYKKYGANPLSGCLPLFIQMPIFIALYNALRTSWALHGSPFIWWIKDLSAKDPYYVLPIAMGILMFVQQQLTMPKMGKENPNMAMMKWMPVFMTVIFLNFPAGLTLYWFVSNCISFVVNFILKRKLANMYSA